MEYGTADTDNVSGLEYFRINFGISPVTRPPDIQQRYGVAILFEAFRQRAADLRGGVTR